jgi:phenylacetate-CoA ligase
VNLYPSAIDDLVRSVQGISEYEVNIRRIAGMDDLSIKIETAEAVSFEETARRLEHSFRTGYSIRVSVEQAPAGSLPRYEFKSKRFKRIS